jgi:hypothetical protein
MKRMIFVVAWVLDFALGLFCVKLVPTGTRTRNLLLRRQAPYPLGHRDILIQKTFHHKIK